LGVKPAEVAALEANFERDEECFLRATDMRSDAGERRPSPMHAGGRIVQKLFAKVCLAMPCLRAADL